MLSRIIKIIIIIALLTALAYVGTCVYSNFISKGGTGGSLKLPDMEKAAYSVYIENTGNLILTDDYEMHGSEVGSRVFILHGFWELRGQKFAFVAGDAVLDEAIFGEITIKKR